MEVEVISDSQLRLLVGFARRIHKRVYGRVRRRFPLVRGSFDPRWKPASRFGVVSYQTRGGCGRSFTGFVERFCVQYRSRDLVLNVWEVDRRAPIEKVFLYSDGGFLDRLYADVLLAAGRTS